MITETITESVYFLFQIIALISAVYVMIHLFFSLINKVL